MVFKKRMEWTSIQCSMFNGLRFKIGLNQWQSKQRVLFSVVRFSIFWAFVYYRPGCLARSCLGHIELFVSLDDKCVEILLALPNAQCYSINNYWQFQLKYIIYSMFIVCEWNWNDNNAVNCKCPDDISYLFNQTCFIFFSFPSVHNDLFDSFVIDFIFTHYLWTLNMQVEHMNMNTERNRNTKKMRSKIEVKQYTDYCPECGPQDTLNLQFTAHNLQTILHSTSDSRRNDMWNALYSVDFLPPSFSSFPLWSVPSSECRSDRIPPNHLIVNSSFSHQCYCCRCRLPL